MIEPTYDILDCGPRNRFVANGKVVHNCDSVNMQNLPSRGGPYAKVLKNCVVPPDGHMIVDCDASQIEARVLAWFAEQDDLVDAFANREDVYKKMASSIYKIPVEEVSKQQRQVGKVAILGCGYGVGGAKFKTVLKLMGGVDVDEDEAKRIVTLYRETNPKIQRLWWDAGAMLERMVQGRDKQFGREGVVRVDHKENAIWLPSGLPILYPDLSVKRSDSRAEYSYKGRGKSRNYIYGGKCVENLTQALARCIIAEQMYIIQQRYRVALTVHDSVVVVVPEAEIVAGTRYIMGCMRYLPDWAKGLPIDCEAEVGYTYGNLTEFEKWLANREQ